MSYDLGSTTLAPATFRAGSGTLASTAPQPLDQISKHCYRGVIVKALHANEGAAIYVGPVGQALFQLGSGEESPLIPVTELDQVEVQGAQGLGYTWMAY